MKPQRAKRPHGQVRLSQTITTFGPGSMMDLPQATVLVAGLDHWYQRGEEIAEPRLVERLKNVLGVAQLQLFAPPADLGDPLAEKTGITVWQFPTWFVVQDEEDDNARLFQRARLLVPQARVTRGRYKDEDKKSKPVVPVRFVRACRSGHIEDIDWYGFAHQDPKTTCRRRLWLEEVGTTGDLADIYVRCDCGKRRAMSDATVFSPPALGVCRGKRPWLGRLTDERCDEPSRLLVRTASNAYFPQTMSAISLPEKNAELTRVVDQLWADLQAVETEENLKYEMKKEKPQRLLKSFSAGEIFREILSRKGLGGPPAPKSVKEAELETLTSVADEAGQDQPDGTFYARALPKDRWSEAPGADKIARVVRVHRLREVVALTGFTRFEAFSPNAGGELEMGVTRAALSTELHWLPAIENRGEGIFISFDPHAVESWLKKPAVQRRASQLLDGFEAWKKDRKIPKDRLFRGLPYVMLHSLSHLLLTAISLECGYPASSIRERVYAFASGYGILLYTGSPDAEGTLGGLVEAGRDLARHLRTALELGRLCSNDPVCAQHDPSNTNEKRFLHGSACHGCLLIAETSCEMTNDYLDRSLVVPTVADPGAAFFE